MKTLPILLAVGFAAAATPAHAATPGIYFDCASLAVQPSSVDLNCLHADATLSGLRWSGRSARGSFNYPSYSVDHGPGVTTLPTRVTVSRPRAIGSATAYTRLTVRLFGSRRDRERLARQLRYVLTCDLGQGWVPARVATPC